MFACSLQDALAEAEASVMEAEAVSSDTIKPGHFRIKSGGPMSPGASADQDMRALVAVIDKARRAATNATAVKSMVIAAETEGVGQYAVGAKEKISLASESALVDITRAGDRYVCIGARGCGFFRF